MINFLNSSTINEFTKVFKHFISNLKIMNDYDRLQFDYYTKYSKLIPICNRLVNKYNELLLTINDDIEKMAGKQSGAIINKIPNIQQENRSGQMIGSGFGNLYLQDSTRKYLM
jgi:hypothetical protein